MDNPNRGPSGPPSPLLEYALCSPGRTTLVGADATSAEGHPPIWQILGAVPPTTPVRSQTVPISGAGIISREPIACLTQVGELITSSHSDGSKRAPTQKSVANGQILKSPRTRAQRQAAEAENAREHASTPLEQPSSPLIDASRDPEHVDSDHANSRERRAEAQSNEWIQISVERLSGDNQQCGYRAVGKALDGWSVEQVHALLVHTAESIDDAPMLHSYGFNVDPFGDAAEVRRAKDLFLNDPHFLAMKEMGDIEWFLVSHAMDGDLSFLFVSPQVDGFVKRKGGVQTTSQVCAVNPYQEIPVTRREVALHWCSYTGSVHAHSPNHFDLLQYTKAGQVSSHWMMATPESKTEYNRRTALLLRAAALSTEMKRAERGESAAVAVPKAAAAASRARGTKTTGPKPVKFPKGYSKTTKQLQSPFAPPAATIPRGPPRRLGHECFKQRPNVWRVIPRQCEGDFLARVNPYFDDYVKQHQETGAQKPNEAVCGILELPSQCLVRGRALKALSSLRNALSQPNGALPVFSPISSTHSTPPAAPVIVASSPPAYLTQPPEVTVRSQAVEEKIEEEHEPAIATLTKAIANNDLQSVYRAIKIIKEGGPRSLRRAMAVLEQSPRVNITDAVIEELRRLHPQSTRTAPLRNVPEGRSLPMVAVDEDLLFDILRHRVNNGSSPGPSGWTGSHLQLIAEKGSKTAKQGLCLLIQDICNGRFTGDAKERLLACTLTPLWKRGENSGIRPIAMGEVLYKLAAHYTMSRLEHELPGLFPRIQFGVMRSGGSEAAAQLIRATVAESMKRDPTTIGIAIDFKNAFNLMLREAAWEKLLATPETEPMWTMFRWAYAEASPLLVYNRQTLHSVLRSEEGARQGDPFSAFVFALCMQKMYESAIKDLPQCHAVAVLDDLTLIGPAEQVMIAYERIKSCAPEYHMELQVQKCQVYLSTDQMADPIEYSQIHQACADRNLRCDARLESLGVMFGTDDDIREHGMNVVESQAGMLAKLSHPAMPVQIGFQLLRYCALPRLSYMARTTPPDLFASAAAKFDSMLADCFTRLSGIDQQSKSPTGESKVTTPNETDLRISLPISMGGTGLRPVVRIHHAAHMASLATILPAFCAAFPDLADNHASTGLHKELSDSRREVLATLGASTPEYTVAAVHATVFGVSSTPSSSQTNPAHPSASQSLSALNPSKRRLGEMRKQASEKAEKILRQPVSKLWEQAQVASLSPAETGKFLQDVRLQAHITHRMELQLYKSLLEASTPYQQVIMTATTMTNGVANAWLTVLPTEPAYCMTNDSFRLALRHRLGLVPYNGLHGQRCRTMNCRSTTAQGVPTTFDHDPDHFHSCSAHRRAHLTVRHNNLVHLLMRLARAVGFYAAHEPNHHQRPPNVPVPSGTDDDDNAKKPRGWNDHADILLVKHDRRLYIDVCVSRPTARSTMTSAREAILSTPLFSCRAPAAAKHSRYDAIAMLNGYQMIPFCMETYGGIAPEAMALLRTLAAHAEDSNEFDPRSFLTHAVKCLNVGLQSGNAFVAEAGMQMHLTNDVRQERLYASQKQYEEKRKVTGRIRRPKVTTPVVVPKSSSPAVPAAAPAAAAAPAPPAPVAAPTSEEVTAIVGEVALLLANRRPIPSKFLSHDQVRPSSIAGLNHTPPRQRRHRPEGPAVVRQL